MGAFSESSPTKDRIKSLMRYEKSHFELLLISFIALFLELAVIRWLSTEIRIFAYFKNLPLMAAFLGFGIGCYFYRSTDVLFYKWFPRFVGGLAAIIALAPVLDLTHVIFVDPRQYFLLGVGFGDRAAASTPSFFQATKAYSVIVFVFILVVATFTALTSKMGEALNRQMPLLGYSINILGSLLGILGFSIASYIESTPLVWLVFVYLLLVYFYWGRPELKLALFYFIGSAAIVGRVSFATSAFWSPYYQIDVDIAADNPSRIGIMVNHDGFQEIQDLSAAYLKNVPERIQRSQNRHYNIPYQLSKRKVESVLILGGGSGNDAAAALRNNASHVDVVEIDPVIARLGRQLHPESPYSSKKVPLHVDDARSYLYKTQRKYDLVVFATLDSHAAFSSLSSIRIDNFVFTKESVQRVRSLLNVGGGIAINFFAINPWLSQRHLNVLEEVMGDAPLAFGSPANQEVILLAGDLFDGKRELGMTDYRPVRLPFTAAKVEPTSDDWPFLFLERRGLPFHYLSPLLIICVLSIIPLRYCQLRVANMNWHLFFMGASFLLIESKAVTTLGLLFGSTWLVNSVVIGSILVMILLANFCIGLGYNGSFGVLYFVLGALLVVNFLFPFDWLNALVWELRLVVAGLVIASPLFVAALIFAQAFNAVSSPSLALASNLFGSLVGGVLEYADMWTGLRWLNLLALALYLVSYLFLRKAQSPVGAPQVQLAS
jgi:Spermine/spermidine synthase domain